MNLSFFDAQPDLQSSSSSQQVNSRVRTIWFVALIAGAIGLAYANSFRGVFVLDDFSSISDNPSIRHLTWAALQPPSGNGSTVDSRPILNLSLAVNYAISGTAIWSYHALNLLIHVAAALVLFDLLRRLIRPAVGAADECALMIALLWALHPLQTESVTYVVQRTESLMGLFYFATLYCQVRGIAAPSGSRSRGWLVASMAFCALGMGTKEVMVSAPILAWLIDRTCLAKTDAEIWRARGWYYGGLFATWIILGVLVAGNFSRGGTIGTAAGVAWWQYAFCQARAIVHYLQLAVWPHPLIFDYGSDLVTFGEIWVYGLIDLALLAFTFRALHRKSVLGLLGAWFFFILAPTTSVVGGTRQMLAEHRMYLPLLAVVVAAVFSLYRFLHARRARIVCALLAAGFALATAARNADYQTDLMLYRDNFQKRPNNAYSAYDLAYVLKERGRIDEAVPLYEAALRLKPDHAESLDDLAHLLSNVPGRETEALLHFEALLKLKPEFPELHNNYAALLARVGRRDEAIAQFETALRLKPTHAEAHHNLAAMLAVDPTRVADALAHYEAALRAKPDYAEAHRGLALLLLKLPGRRDDALSHFAAAVRFRPEFFEAQTDLALTLVGVPGQGESALQHFEAALRLRPDSAEAHFNVAMALLRFTNRRSEAALQLADAVRLKPDFAAAQSALRQLQPPTR